MGGLFSRNRVVLVDLTSQYSNELKQIDEELLTLQTRKQAQISFHRRLKRNLILCGTFVWLLVILTCLYLIDFGNRNHVVARLLKIGPIVACPIILFLLKYLIDCYYTLQWRKCDVALSKLEKSKETKLDELMAKTNFKATQQLITQFSEKKKPNPATAAGQAANSAAQTGPAGSPTENQRHTQQHGGRPGMPPTTPASARFQSQTVPASAFKIAQQQHQQQQQLLLQQKQQHASIGSSSMSPPSDSLNGGSSNRSSLDKVLDFILNDGPNNKYALICIACAGHNGLVREQELGKLRFRCALCGVINGPPLPPQQQQQQHAAPMTPGPNGSSSSQQQHGGAFTPGPPPQPVPLTPFAPLERERRKSLNGPILSDDEHDGDGDVTLASTSAGASASESAGEASEVDDDATNKSIRQGARRRRT